MKKYFILTALILLIATSVLAGTLAVYNVNIDNFAQSDAIAKEFILEENQEDDTFEFNVPIGPGETKEFHFAVRNYRGNLVSEVPIDSEITVTMDAAPRNPENLAEGYLEPIREIVATISETDGQGNELKQISRLSFTGSNKIAEYTFKDFYPLSEAGLIKYYKVAVYWPEDAVQKSNIIAGQLGNRIRVNVRGDQRTSGSENPDPNPDPNPNPNKFINTMGAFRMEMNGNLSNGRIYSAQITDNFRPGNSAANAKVEWKKNNHVSIRYRNGFFTVYFQNSNNQSYISLNFLNRDVFADSIKIWGENGNYPKNITITNLEINGSPADNFVLGTNTQNSVVIPMPLTKFSDAFTIDFDFLVNTDGHHDGKKSTTIDFSIGKMGD